MAISKSKLATASVAGALLVLSAGLAACHAHPASNETTPDEAANEEAGEATAETALQDRPRLGLMTSLPIYWPLDADLGVLASGRAKVPWQREVLERRFELVALDTLSPIADIDPDAASIDPLEGLTFLAVIQPRVLTQVDNVALDDWVRGGGRLLLVLDPALDGHYPLPLGDPRRPVEAALIPPVLAHWGLEMRFDEAQNAPGRDGANQVRLGDATLPLHLAGTLRENAGPENAGVDGVCTIIADAAAAQCTLGEGRVTLLADAEVFKDAAARDHAHDHAHGQTAPDDTGQTSVDELKVAAIQELVAIAFEEL